jgi:hypothetical protein
MLLAGDEVSGLFLLGMAGETSFLSRKMVDLVQGGGRLYMLDGDTAVVERWMAGACCSTAGMRCSGPASTPCFFSCLAKLYLPLVLHLKLQG